MREDEEDCPKGWIWDEKTQTCVEITDVGFAINRGSGCDNKSRRTKGSKLQLETKQDLWDNSSVVKSSTGLDPIAKKVMRPNARRRRSGR